MTDHKKQELADRFTLDTLKAMWGEPTIENIDTIEETQFNNDWEMLNGAFYSIIEKYTEMYESY